MEHVTLETVLIIDWKQYDKFVFTVYNEIKLKSQA